MNCDDTSGVTASQPEQGEVFWLYELTKGEGVYQGVRGPDAEKIMRQVVSGIEEAGEPFPVRTFGVGVPAFDPTQPCDMQRLRDGWKPGFGGVPTMCMRCKNPHHACDGGGVAIPDGSKQ